MSTKSCRYTDNRTLANKYKGRALEQIERLNVPATPVHFTLMYELVSQTDPEFAQEIKHLISNQQYTDESVRPLFRSLLRRTLYQYLPTEKVGALIDEVLTDLESWSHDSNAQQALLKESITRLKMCDNKENAINCLEEKVLPSIHQIQQNTQQLHQKINDSSLVIKRLKQELDHATNLAKTDSLTGIPNRRGFDELVQQRIQAAQKKQQPFAMLLLDLDYFKKVNDQYGHLVGDSVLRYVARTLQAVTKGQDAIARLGGEEFIILLTDISYENAVNFAEKVRKLIANKAFIVKDHEQSLNFTISIGVALYKMDETAEQLFERADRALYLAKQSGRNLTCGENQL